jgi:hypothetical protein
MSIDTVRVVRVRKAISEQWQFSGETYTIQLNIVPSVSGGSTDYFGFLEVHCATGVRHYEQAHSEATYLERSLYSKAEGMCIALAGAAKAGAA